MILAGSLSLDLPSTHGGVTSHQSCRKLKIWKAEKAFSASDLLTCFRHAQNLHSRLHGGQTISHRALRVPPGTGPPWARWPQRDSGPAGRQVPLGSPACRVSVTGSCSTRVVRLGRPWVVGGSPRHLTGCPWRRWGPAWGAHRWGRGCHSPPLLSSQPVSSRGPFHSGSFPPALHEQWTSSISL